MTRQFIRCHYMSMKSLQGAVHPVHVMNSGGSRKKYLGGLAPHRLGGNDG